MEMQAREMPEVTSRERKADAKQQKAEVKLSREEHEVQGTSKTKVRKGAETEKNATPEYMYDFGKHRGKTLVQVESEDAGYAAWGVVNGVHLLRPNWHKALVAADLWQEVSRKVEERRMKQRVADVKAEYTYDFGKHRGKTLGQVQAEDMWYPAWCMLSGVRLQRPSWREALVAADLICLKRSGNSSNCFAMSFGADRVNSYQCIHDTGNKIYQRAVGTSWRESSFVRSVTRQA